MSIGVFVQTNDTAIGRPGRTIGYVIEESGCWTWIGSKTALGYGKVCLGEGRRAYAHRWMYEQERGAIPAGLVLDHLCRNPSCVNPYHLEPVTQRENTHRGVGPAATRAKQTHCMHGHPLSGDNVRIVRNGTRRCAACHREKQRVYSARARAACRRTA